MTQENAPTRGPTALATQVQPCSRERRPAFLTQDLHIHTTWSTGDESVVAEQTVDLVADIRHAQTMGISDHFEFLADGAYEAYERAVRARGLRLGMEVNGHPWVNAALDARTNDYFIFHCFDRDADYRALEHLLASEKPVIVAHPNALQTNLARVPPEALIEINNRYVWRCDWRRFYAPFSDRFHFVISSDAHQPNWLGQSVARHVAAELGLTETLVFEP